MLTIAAVWSAAIYYYYYVGTYFDGGVEEKGKPSSIASGSSTHHPMASHVLPATRLPHALVVRVEVCQWCLWSHPNSAPLLSCMPRLVGVTNYLHPWVPRG